MTNLTITREEKIKKKIIFQFPFYSLIFPNYCDFFVAIALPRAQKHPVFYFCWEDKEITPVVKGIYVLKL